MLLLQALLVFVLKGKKYSDEGIIIIFWFEWLLFTLSVISLSFIRVVVGENKNFSSFAEKIMADAGVEVTLVQVITLPRMLILIMIQDEGCIQMMKNFIENNGPLWNEDIHEFESDCQCWMYSKKPTHNGSQFTLMLLFISGQMIFCCLTIVNFGKKLQKEFWKGGEGL